MQKYSNASKLQLETCLIQHEAQYDLSKRLDVYNHIHSFLEIVMQV